MSINNKGFTLIELMIVVAIIGVLAAIAYPSYERYIVKSKRADMMTELQNVASNLQSEKLAQGKYSNALKTGLTGDYPRQGTALYTVSIGNEAGVTGTDLTDKWLITSIPKTNQRMKDDGTLTLNHQGIKCRNISTTIKKCGSNDEWNK